VAVLPSQQRKLAQLSGNVCAFPDCHLLLTAEGTPDDPVVVLGEMAHIVAESPNGPRGDSPLTTEERNRYENLILLCNQHHQLIDSKEALPKYTVERLHAMKQAHEQWVRRTLAGRANTRPELPPVVQDTVYSNVLSVTQMPRYVYGAPCELSKESELRPSTTPRRADDAVHPPRGRLWAFQDLRDDAGPFAEVVACAEAERFQARGGGRTRTGSAGTWRCSTVA
jgi:hypothetical protein